QLTDEPAALQTNQPTVVLGYTKEFLNELHLEADGRLTLFARRVMAGGEDRFCPHRARRLGHQEGPDRLAPLNGCFMAGADKGVAYALLNEYARANPGRYFPGHIEFARVDCRAALIAGILDWLRRGRKVVIKPQGTGLGHGLEFFLDSGESMENL